MHRQRQADHPGAGAPPAARAAEEVRPGLDSAAAVLALQASAGNQAVARAVRTLARDRGTPESGSQATPDAGAPATDAGSTSDDPEQTRVDAIVKKYRDMIAAARADGKNVAADNLQHWLDGKGGVRKIDVKWLRGFGCVTDAEDTNKGRFETSLNKQANGASHGDKKTFTDHWDRMFTASTRDELYYASGTSTLTSKGTFELSVIENEVTIGGTVLQHWHDPYDWHAGLSAYIPGFGSISDADALLVEKLRGAKPFEMEADWTQSLSGLIKVGKLWNTKTFTWSGP